MGDRLFDEWRVYEKLLIHDYMDHRAFFGRLGDEIAARFDRPVILLDLGCGDLGPMRPLLRSTPVARYVGIDEAESALAIAGERLRGCGFTHELVHGDLRDALHHLEGPFDVVVASFTLHHLAEPADKQATFAACRGLLGADGFIAMIDVFSGAGETREQYIDRWIAHADQRYQELSPDEKGILFDHVRARDFPVSLDRCRNLARDAGLPSFDILLADEPELNHLVLMSR
ncbi:MAG: class I SAM-dependent methyltransferase [Xanthomonadales bacterium]|nr:class I SAM-dependent methyltransferase [Xanthomonadales bacterium]